MDHPEIDERVDVFMAENFSHLDKDSKEYEEEAGVRKFTLHFVKCRMTSVKEALKKGDAFLIPVKIKVDDKTIRFKAVFTVVSELVCVISFVYHLFEFLLSNSPSSLLRYYS